MSQRWAAIPCRYKVRRVWLGRTPEAKWRMLTSKQQAAVQVAARIARHAVTISEAYLNIMLMVTIETWLVS